MDGHRQKLVDMYRKGKPAYRQVKLLMDNTFPKRRREVLVDNTRVWKLLQDYPFLKDDKGIQMKAELGRIEDKANIGKEIIEEAAYFGNTKESQCRAVKNILVKLDDCAVADEKE